jgi:hypothetical protein
MKRGCQLREVKQAIEGELNRLASAANFMSLEKIKSNFVLEPEEFKVGEILTPTMKL